MGLFVLGATITSAFNIESDRALTPGESIQVGAHEFEMREIRDVQGPNYSAIEAVIEIRKDGEFAAIVRPQKRQYLVQKNWMTEAGIHVDWNKDLFVALGDQLGNGAWSVRVQYKPMIRFIWFGAIIMALGGLIAVSDRRYRLKASKRSEVGQATAETDPEGPDLHGGFRLRTSRGERIDAQSLRIAAGLAALTGIEEDPAAGPALRAAMRYAIQLTVRPDGAWAHARPERALGGVRASTWSGDLPVAAQAIGLLTVLEAREVLE